MKKPNVTTIVLLFIASVACAQTPQNPLPISGPTTITRSGYYRLTNNIGVTATTGNIITVQAHNVTIDFNGFFIIGPNNPASQVTGVSADEIGNTTIKNGTIAFCIVGIKFSGNSSATTKNINNTVENMRITNCYLVGFNCTDRSPGTSISNCQISQIGGTTRFASFAAGINCGQGILVKENIVSGVTAPTSFSANSFGIEQGIGVRNTVSECHTALDGGKYQNNLTYLVTTVLGGNATDAGGNF